MVLDDGKFEYKYHFILQLTFYVVSSSIHVFVLLKYFTMSETASIEYCEYCNRGDHSREMPKMLLRIVFEIQNKNVFSAFYDFIQLNKSNSNQQKPVDFILEQETQLPFYCGVNKVIGKCYFDSFMCTIWSLLLLKVSFICTCLYTFSTNIQRISTKSTISNVHSFVLFHFFSFQVYLKW